jgi:hypothetical protein
MNPPQAKTSRIPDWMHAVIDLMAGGRRRGTRSCRPRRSTGRSKTVVIAAGQRDDPRIQPGDYFSSGRSLYRVEHLAGARVLLEDCHSGELVDIDRETCVALECVKRCAGEPGCPPARS